MGLLSRFGITAFAVIIGVQTSAQVLANDKFDALIEALEIPAVIAIMQEEGATYGATIGQDMLPNGGGGTWPNTVAAIYDPKFMMEKVRAGFVSELTEQDIVPLLAFFTSETGREIAGLEISARRAFLDTSIEDAARENYRAVLGSENPLLAQITEIIQINDLIDYNVVGALNSNFQFYRGLDAGGAFEMSEEEMLNEAWAAEEETRTDTKEWMFAYLLMAYQPLDAPQVQAYIEMSKSDHGRALNRALFVGFDDMYSDITYALGLAVAAHMAGQDL